MGVTWGALLLIFAPLSAGTFNPLAIPGKLGLFEAAFGQEGIMSQQAELIDTKVKANLRNRIRMDLQPIEYK